MKRAVLPVTVLAAIAIFVATRSSGETPDYVAQVGDRLPESAVFTMVVESVEELFAETDEGPAFPILAEIMEEVYGLSGDTDALIEAGFDPSDPIVFSLIDIRRPRIMFMVGFDGDLDAVEAVLNGLGELVDGELERREIDGREYLFIAGELLMRAEGGVLVAAWARNAWIFGHAELDEAANVIERVIDESWDAPLSGHPHLARATEFPRTTRATFWWNLEETVRQANVVAGGELDDERLHMLVASGFGVGGDAEHQYGVNHLILRDTDAVATLLGPSRSMAPLRRIPGPIEIGAHFSVEPSYFDDSLSFASDMGDLPDYATRNLPDLLMRVFRFEPETLTPFASGEAGVFLSRYHPFEPASLRACAFFGLTDADAFASLLAEAAGNARLPVTTSSQGDVVTHRVVLENGTQATLFVDGDYVWVVLGDDYANEVLAGGASFLDDPEPLQDDTFEAEAVFSAWADASALMRYNPEPWELLTRYLARGSGGSPGYARVRSDVDGAVVTTLIEGYWSDEPAPEFELPPRPPGMTRATPLAVDETVELKGWRVRVERVDTIAGIVRVGIVAECVGQLDNSYSLNGWQFALTDASHRHYVADNEWSLAAHFSPESDPESARVVRHTIEFTPLSAQADRMLAIADPLRPWSRDDWSHTWFVALDEGATIPSTPADRPLSTSSDDEPVPLGEVAHLRGWDVRVVEVLHDAEAKARMRAQQSYVSDPADGQVYLQVRVEAVRTADWEGYESLGPTDFLVRDAGASMLEGIFSYNLYALQPELNLAGYPGLRSEGWLAFEVPSDAVDLRLVWPDYRSQANAVVLALE